VVDPGALHAFHRALPPVVVEQILVNDRSVPLQSPLRLPPGSGKLEIRYASLSFLIPRFVRYRLKLDGVDSGWVERGNQRVAQYTNLSPGHFRFQVNASAPSIGQGWSHDITTLDIDIQPRFWQEAWFHLFAVLAALLALAGFIRWRVGSVRRRADALEAVVDQRTRDLRDQADRLLQADHEKSVLLAKLQEQSEAFERQALEDALTGLANRRGINEELARAFDRATRYGKPLSFALLDLDHFKRINDTYSHLAGDHALIVVAGVLAAEAGALGTVARWGGEEFALLFEGLGLDDARRCCERVREAVERLDCSAFAPGWKMTISGGVVERTGLAYHEKLVSRADDLLYEAKREGRNRICG
jgi:diguanylate cyclase (GGDEF)-like protein